MEVRTTDGINIGSPPALTLNGDNPVVDRRSITFNAKDPSVKKVANYGLDGGANGAPQGDDSSGSRPSRTEVAPSGSAAPFIPQDAYQKTPEEEVKTRPAGCGCFVAGQTGRASMAGVGGFALGLSRCSPRRRR